MQKYTSVLQKEMHVVYFTKTENKDMVVFSEKAVNHESVMVKSTRKLLRLLGPL